MKNNNVEIKNKLDEITDGLIDELENGYTENYIRFIKTMSQFHKYSLRNIFLIYSQYPEAQKVAGFTTWKKLGLNIVKGSKAIKIVAPKQCKYIIRDSKRVFYSDMTAEEKLKTSEHKIMTIYNYVNVFDISQVEGKEKEKLSFFYPLGNDEKQNYINLKNKIESDGIQVIESEDTKGAEGLSYGGKIVIKDSLDYTNKFLTLIHEYAHEKLDQGVESDRDNTNKRIRELRAETVSYVVCNYMNIKNPFTVDYIKSYGNKKEDLKEHLEKILKCSMEIINILEK